MSYSSNSKRGEALAGELDHALDVVGRHQGRIGLGDGLAQLGVARRGRSVPPACGHCGKPRRMALRCRLRSLEPVTSAATFCSSTDLPVDELLDVGMVEIEDDHLGGAARGAAGLDRAGGAVADLQEAHQPARLAAAGQRLAFAAQGREIGAGAGAVLEDACLADPQVHDAAFVHQVVVIDWMKQACGAGCS